MSKNTNSTTSVLRGAGGRGFKASTLVLAVIFAFFFTMGCGMENNGNVWIVSGNAALSLLITVALACAFYFAIAWAESHVRLREDGEDYWTRTKAFIWVPAVLFIGMLPHLICNLPGSVTYDAKYQLSQALGMSKLYNHNPVLDTWIYGFFFRAGRVIFRSDNGGVMGIALFQLFMFALSFSWLIYEGYRLVKSKLFIFLSLAFYIIIPMFGGAAQVVLKDSLHLPFFIMLLACQTGILREPSKGKIALYGLLLALTSLTRAMAMLYAFAGGIAMLLVFIVKKKSFRGLMASAVLAAALIVVLWDHALLPALDIGKYPSLEKYSLPLQQAAYVTVNHELTAEETAAIENILDVETIREVYDPNLSDPLKQNFKYGEMGPFWKVYISWYFKYPKDMLKSIFVSYYKYLYPYSIGKVNYRSYIQDCSDIGLYFSTYFPTLRKVAAKYAQLWEELPLLPLFVGPGLYSWVLIYALARKRREYWPVFMPLLFLFIGLFLAAVNGETRYALPIIAASPLMLALTRPRRDF